MSVKSLQLGRVQDHRDNGALGGSSGLGEATNHQQRRS